MSTIRVTSPVNQTRYLKQADPSGNTFVVMRPPGYAEESERGEALSQRTIIPTDDGGFKTQIDANVNELWALEIWLTYVEANLKVEFVDEDDKVTSTVEFQPRKEMGRSRFLAELGKLPPYIVYEWVEQVHEVVPGWTFPF